MRIEEIREHARVLENIFPDPETASPEGIVACGGSLQPAMLLAAYRRGIFPWFNEHEPILWWSPDPRCVLYLKDFHLPERSARAIRASGFAITFDTAFRQVIEACAAPRPGSTGTWLTKRMLGAYILMHKLGIAHSVEAWRGKELAGGLYGLALGRIFFGESMFHKHSEASRAALACLVERLVKQDFLAIDCQQETPHMRRMGASIIPRPVFLKLLAENLPRDQVWASNWQS